MSNNTLVYNNILSCCFRNMDRGSKVGVWNEQLYSKFIIAYCHVVFGIWIEAAKLVFGMSNNTLVYNNILSCCFRNMDRGSKVGVWNEQ